MLKKQNCYKMKSVMVQNLLCVMVLAYVVT